jgi:hypothetical protein
MSRLDEETWLRSDDGPLRDSDEEVSFPLILLHGTGDEVLECGDAGTVLGVRPRISALFPAIEYPFKSDPDAGEPSHTAVGPAGPNRGRGGVDFSLLLF